MKVKRYSYSVHAAKRRKGSGGVLHSFFNSSLEGGEWSPSLPCCSTPGTEIR